MLFTAYDQPRTLPRLPPPFATKRARVIVGAAYSDAELYQHARSILAPLNFNESQEEIIAAIGKFESNYGLTGQFAPTGQPSYNWGAITGTGPTGLAVTLNDRDKNGKIIVSQFRAYDDAKAGLLDFLKVWAHPGTTQETAILSDSGDGNALAVARRMYANGYYTGTAGTDEQRIQAYANAIAGAAKAYAAAVSLPYRVSASGPFSGGGGGTYTLDPVIITADDDGTKKSADSGNGLLIGGAAAVAVVLGAVALRR